MAKYMKKGAVIEMAVHYFPAFLESRRQAIITDRWVTGQQYDIGGDGSAAIDVDPTDPAYGLPFAPRTEETTEEYENLRSLAPNPFARLVVTSVAQTAYVEGIRRPKQKTQLKAWETWQRNGWDSYQTPIHRAAIGMGQAFGVVSPGSDPLTGDKMSRMIGKSPKVMEAFYDSPSDEWATIAIEAHPRAQRTAFGTQWTGWDVTIYDAQVNHRLTCRGAGTKADDWEYIDHVEHGLSVPPVARLVNSLDLDGRSMGEIEPVLPLLRRLDQGTFDRLIVQRFGAWQVRYIAGMAKPTSKDSADALKMRLKIEDILVSTNPDTKFGVLPAGPLEPLTKVTDADLRILSAVTQLPPHHLLGLSSNLQAEALAAAEAGLQRKSFDFRQNAGEFHERMARLTAMADGDKETARAWDLQVRWRETESRSMTQAADALGKLAVQLKVPLEMLWEKIPGWTDTDVERAKELVKDGTFETLVREVMDGVAPQDQNLDQAASQGADDGGDGADE